MHRASLRGERHEPTDEAFTPANPVLTLLFAAGGLAPDLRAQAAAPGVAPPAGVRTLYLVRHGAYDNDDPRDERWVAGCCRSAWRRRG